MEVPFGVRFFRMVMEGCPSLIFAWCRLGRRPMQGLPFDHSIAGILEACVL